MVFYNNSFKKMDKPKRMSSFSKFSMDNTSNSLRRAVTVNNLSSSPLNKITLQSQAHNKKDILKDISKDNTKDSIIEEIKEVNDAENEDDSKVKTIIYEPVDKGIGEKISELLDDDNSGFMNWFCCTRKQNDHLLDVEREKNENSFNCFIF